MAATFSYEQLNADTGTNTANGLRNVANQAANAACSLYKNYSDAATGLPDPTGLGAALNGLYSNLCGPRGDNPTSPPSIPYNGGQCSNRIYNVTINYTGPSGAASVFFPGVPGPLGAVGVKSNPSGSAQYGVFAPNYTAGNGFLAVASASAPNPVNTLSAYRVTGVTPVSTNGADNCGDPPPQYRTPPPPSNSLVINNNTVNVGAGFVINAPITIVPILNKADIQINPQIDVQVGPFNVTFDAGGIQVQPNINLPSDKTNPSPDLYPTPKPTPREPVSIDCPEVDLTPILNRLTDIDEQLDDIEELSDEIKECSCPVGYDVAVTTIGSGDSGQAALPNHTIQVRLIITEAPVNAKIQKGGSSHPDYYFCGYYAFGEGTAEGARTPISLENSIFECPPFATAFGWVLYNGYNCTVQALHLVPEKADSQLAVVQMKKAPA